MASIIGVETLQHTNGTTAATIDSSGRILQPAKPACRLGLTASQSETQTGTVKTVLWNDTNTDNCFIQGGISVASGGITVPVDGLYQINSNIRLDSLGTGYGVMYIIINGEQSNQRDTYIISGDPASNYENFTGSEVFKLSANDEITIGVLAQSDTNWVVSSNSTVSVVLIG